MANKKVILMDSKITKLSKQKEENDSNENVFEDKTVPKEKGGPKGLEPTLSLIHI